jgi:GNAT superfamily N-acetyltransferase
MKTDPQLAAAANENFVASFRKPAEHCPAGEVRTFGGVFAFVTGLPIAFFNGCLVLEPAAAADLAAAVDWVGEREVPHKVFAVPELEPEVGTLVLASGFLPDEEPYPGMVLHPLPDAPRPAPGVTVVAVDGAGLDEYLDVQVAAGLSASSAETLFSPSFAADPDVRLFTARLDGRPVGGSLALRSDAASGVYAVGTLEAARRRGVGTALTWAAIEAGREWGRDVIVLQSSPMAVSLYADMGFRTLVPYASFTRRP